MKRAEMSGLSLSNRQIGSMTIGRVEIPLGQSLVGTVINITNMPNKIIRKLYLELTGDERKDINIEASKAFIAGHVQEMWFELQDMDIPVKCLLNQERRLEAALTLTEEDCYGI
jgi:hypothetical protein